MKKIQKIFRTTLLHPISFIAGGILCCFFAVGYLIIANKKTSQLTQTALYLKKKEGWMRERKALEKKLLEQLKVASSNYIEAELEPLVFLKPEVQKLQALLYTDPGDESCSKRHHFLTQQNRLKFCEQNFQRLNGFQEVEVIQKHPVEMNRDDLKNLLARIENVTIDPFGPSKPPPDLLIKKFELMKKTMNSTEETFVINLELIKHEMIHD